MTWAATDQSLDDGSPIDLHEFVYGARFYRYASSDTEYVDANSVAWQTAPIRSDSIEEDQAEGRSDLTLVVAPDIPMLNPFKDGVPYMEYTMYQVHGEDGDQEVITMFKGRATDVTYRPADFEAEILCRSYSSVMDELMLRRKCQAQCPHGLYTADCGVARLAYKRTAQVVSVTGSVVVVSGPAVEGTTDDFFPGGYVEWVHSTLGVAEERMISQWDSSTKTATLVAAPPGLVPGSVISMYPGCDHLLVTCDNKFKNARRFGGVPFKPDDTPFGGKALY